MPQVQDDPRGAAALCRLLHGIDGVADVQANPVAGRVTVLYDGRSTTRARGLEALGHPQPAPARSNVVADAVAKHLADTAIHALVAALI